MDKETLIELRAKYLFSKQFPHSIWDNVHDGTREVYLTIAKEEVEWFAKQGLVILDENDELPKSETCRSYVKNGNCDLIKQGWRKIKPL